MGKFTTVYKCPDGTDFPVQWDDPELERFGWRWDQVHCPLPLTPLSQELWEVLHTGFARVADVTGRPTAIRVIYANGYAFSRQAPFNDDPKVRAAVGERDANNRMDRLLDLWEREYRPEAQALTRSLWSFDGSKSTLRQLAGRLDEVRAARRRHGELHTLTLSRASEAANRFINFCTAEFGESGEAMALELMQGFPNKSVESAMKLWELSRQVKLKPEVETLLRTTSPTEFLQRVGAVPGGMDFQVQLHEFLEEDGHRNESFSELSFPTWREDPRFALFVIKRYLDSPDEASPTALHAETVKRREQALAEVEPLLATDPDKLTTFRAWLVSAQQRTVLLEDHNFYIDQQGFSALRVPLLAIGRALVQQGNIASPEDIFYLYEAEIQEAAVHPRLQLRRLVARRRAERERWLHILPPASIGSGKVEVIPQLQRSVGVAPEEEDNKSIINGIGGSPGVVSGIARVILTLAEVGRLAPGEILVTYATVPSWTSLFGVAGGVVTDAGGSLSHCAIVAREFGIPAVVGAKVATARIRDGIRITIDGTQGIVRLEE